ncbi:MAG: peptidylprolyl isomerase, partial [Paludibacter sp.]
MTIKKILLLFVLNAFIISSCTAKKHEFQRVKFKTTKGTIVVKLYPETSKHSENFLKLVESGMYDGVLFHRVIADFMIQAGDPDSKNASPDKLLGSGDVGYSIPAEFVYPKYYHKKGALAAAREGDNVNPQ